jgi:glutamine cyclotransferase
MTVNEFLQRYDNKDTFTEDEIHDLYCGDIEGEIEEIEEIEGEHYRWVYCNTKILKMQDRYFDVSAYIGLTEMQDNEYTIQPFEVRPVEKVVVVTSWEEI